MGALARRSLMSSGVELAFALLIASAALALLVARTTPSSAGDAHAANRRLSRLGTLWFQTWNAGLLIGIVVLS